MHAPTDTDRRGQALVIGSDEPLIAVPIDENGHTVVRYEVDTDDAPGTERSQTTKDALALIGAWSDLDWDEMVEALDRIRHESTPTPPIDLSDL